MKIAQRRGLVARLVVTTTLADGEYTDSQSQSQQHRSPDTRNQPNLIGAAGVQIACLGAHRQTKHSIAEQSLT